MVLQKGFCRRGGHECHFPPVTTDRRAGPFAAMTESQRIARAMKEEPRPDGWWITGWEIDMGPYATKDEARSDRVGVGRFLRHEHEPGFVSVCE